MINAFAELIPANRLSDSGLVFYSGRMAFGSKSKLYILGLNPGGDGDPRGPRKDETLSWHTNKVLNEFPEMWSAYCDESWGNRPKGTKGLQPRVLHLLRSLNLDPRLVPSSNLIFSRSRREKDLRALGASFETLAEECWPLHQSVIEQLGIRVILCFGKSAGDWVKRRLNVEGKPVGEFVEQNSRKWRTVAYKNSHGVFVIVATHPSIADWTSTSSDPSPLIRQVLEQA